MNDELTDDELEQAIAACEANATALEDQLGALKEEKRKNSEYLVALRDEQETRYRATLEDIPPTQGVGI